VNSKAKKRAASRARAGAPSRHATHTHVRPVVAPRRREARLYAYALGLAALAGSVLIGLSVISANRSTGAPPPGGGTSAIVGGAETAGLLDGIPQRGNRLGSSAAPVQLVEYADPQCPYCALYARDVLPTLIREYVRPGRVQLVFRGLWFLGPDSGVALRTAAAAASEHRLWNVLELLYRNQGPENSWVTDELLRSIATGAGADAARVIAARDGAAVTGMVDRWGRLAEADGVDAVPAFFLGRRGGPVERLELTALAAPDFRRALDNALQR